MSVDRPGRYTNFYSRTFQILKRPNLFQSSLLKKETIGFGTITSGDIPI